MTNLNDFIELLYKTKDKELLEDFVLGLTTPHERHVLLRRVDIIKRLLDEEPQHDIAQDLGVGVSTVTRGARELSRGRFKILRNKR